MELWNLNKINKDEAFRIQAVDFAIKLHNFRDDITRDPEKIINDAKRIETYLKGGT
jgi:hypothetical protein